jgi:hypothetical protein
MRGGGQGSLPNQPAGFFAAPWRIEKAKVFSPRNVDQHVQAISSRKIQKPGGRDKVNPQEIGPKLQDPRKVARRLFG